MSLTLIVDPNVIDADVVQESAPTHRARPISGLARVSMVAVMVFLGGVMYALVQNKNQLAQKMPATPAAPVAVATAGETPVPEVKPSRLAAAKAHVQRLDSALRERTPTLPATLRQLTREEYEDLRLQVSQSLGRDVSDADMRRVVMKAGYRMPELDAAPRRAVAESDLQETAEFAGSIAKELVKDEVESFIRKAQIISQVGEFLAGDRERVLSERAVEVSR